MHPGLLGAALGLSCSLVPTFLPGSAAQLALAGIAVMAAITAAWLPSPWARRCWLVAGTAAGYAWSACAIQGLLAARVGGCADATTQRVVARIVGEPAPVRAPLAGTVRFAAEVLETTAGACKELRGRRLRLTWYGAPELRSGDVWRLDVRVRRPWGFANPAGFDFPRWLLGRNIQATGYVLNGQLLAAAPPTPLTQARTALRQTLLDGGLSGGGVIYALLTGEGGHIDFAVWESLRDTATVHLLVVSGLHVGLVVVLIFGSCRLAAGALPWLLPWFSRRRAAALAACLMSGTYVAFTGFGIAAQRAWLMASVALLAAVAGTRLHSMSVVGLVYLGVLAWQPATLHQQGFWLSFSAVAALVWYFARRLPTVAGWRSLLHAQWAIALALTPLTAVITGKVAGSGPLVNLIVVPLVSLVILPFSLLGAALLGWWSDAATLMFAGVDWAVRFTFDLLSIAAEQIRPQWVAASARGLGATLAGFALLRALPGRSVACLGLAWGLWLLSPNSGVPPTEFRVWAVDVGQGSAILIDTHRHRLLFDTGPGYPSGFNMASSAVLPTLAATGAPRLDALVLSHPDLDHVGGRQTIVDSIPVGISYGPTGVAAVTRCNDGQRWDWDGVTFEFVNAGSQQAQLPDNDRSCVLRIDNGRRSALLAGDASAAIEAALVRRVRPVDLLFAPHHGSNSSSSKAFVRLLQPRLVFVSAGYRNRFGHPHPQVVERYHQIGASVWVTARSGALEWRSWQPQLVGRQRHSAPYWQYAEDQG